MVPLFPALYGDMAPLRNEAEPDADFFLNITHIQRHRRTRALQRFAEYCKCAPTFVCECVVVFVFVSLLVCLCVLFAWMGALCASRALCVVCSCVCVCVCFAFPPPSSPPYGRLSDGRTACAAPLGGRAAPCPSGWSRPQSAPRLFSRRPQWAHAL